MTLLTGLVRNGGSTAPAAVSAIETIVSFVSQTLPPMPLVKPRSASAVPAQDAQHSSRRATPIEAARFIGGAWSRAPDESSLRRFSSAECARYACCCLMISQPGPTYTVWLTGLVSPEPCPVKVTCVSCST